MLIIHVLVSFEMLLLSNLSFLKFYVLDIIRLRIYDQVSLNSECGSNDHCGNGLVCNQRNNTCGKQ